MLNATSTLALATSTAAQASSYITALVPVVFNYLVGLVVLIGSLYLVYSWAKARFF